MRHSIILAVSIFFMIPVLAFSAILKVPSRYPTIQDAIDAASTGDTILVAPGTYVENIDFIGKAITVTSEQGADVTVIDGNQAGSVVTLQNGEAFNSVIEGFTITNGYGTGSGVYCRDSSPKIKNNIIKDHMAYSIYSVGGGIYCENSSPMITSNSIIGNTSINGGGICCVNYSNATITNNIISDNRADAAGGVFTGRGGGIYCGSSSPLITNNTIAENTADSEGGGIFIISYSYTTVTNTIFWGNDAPFGPEIWIGYQYLGPSTLTISYSDVEGGQASVYVDPTSTLNWGAGNIDADPLFADPVNDNFHLTWLSPCINRGTNTEAPILDIDGDPRPYMSTVEMGADEFTGKHPLEADIFTLIDTTDGQVNFSLFGDTPNGGRYYILLGSVSGMVPGSLLPGGKAILPLNWDLFTNVIIDYINTTIFSNFMGTLDGTGSATATFDTLQPVSGLVGTTLHFAFALNNPWDFVSNPVGITIIPSDTNWRQYAFDNGNTGYNPYETEIGPTTVQNLQFLWKRSFSSSTYVNPAVVDGVVYTGTYGDYFYALDAETGNILWQQYVNGSSSDPAVYDGVIYIGSRHTPVIYALDAKDGSIVWSTPVAEKCSCAPALANGLVYMITYDYGTLYALDAQSGNPVWSVFIDGLRISPTVVNGIVYAIGYYNDLLTIYAMDALTGAPLWEATLSNDVASILPGSVTVSQGVVYTGCVDGKLYALDALTGNTLWTANTGGMVVSAPAVAKGVVYFSSDDSKLHAVDIETHEYIWSISTKNWVWGIPTVANDVVYMTDKVGPKYVYAFNAKTGDQLWEYDLGSLSYNGSPSPTVANGKVFVSATFNYSIYAFHLPD